MYIGVYRNDGESGGSLVYTGVYRVKKGLLVQCSQGGSKGSAHGEVLGVGGAVVLSGLVSEVQPLPL